MAVVALVLIAIGGLLSLLNWATLIATYRSGRFVSAVPLIGGLALGLGLALLPATRPYCWVALVADYGTLVAVIAMPRVAAEIWSTSRFNLVHAFTASAGGRAVTVRLYRRGVAVISAEFDPPAPCNDRGARVVSLGMVGTWAATETGFTVDGYGADRRLVVSQAAGTFTAAELNYPADARYPYDRLDGLALWRVK